MNINKLVEDGKMTIKLSGRLDTTTAPELEEVLDFSGINSVVFDIEDFDTGREFYLVYDDKITMSPTSETFKFFVLEKYGYKFEY